MILVVHCNGGIEAEQPLLSTNTDVLQAGVCLDREENIHKCVLESSLKCSSEHHTETQLAIAQNESLHRQKRERERLLPPQGACVLPFRGNRELFSEDTTMVGSETGNVFLISWQMFSVH